MQYLIHQGFTQYNATFWVGANALLRKKALEAIATVDEERGYPITRYIQDRTVIEDTESTVDLVAKNWRLFNYPERLAYSATPPDFGSLIIQRRRWANGGLIILPKFLQCLFRPQQTPSRLGHAAMGTHYLTSLAGVNLGVILLLTLPVEQALHSLWLPLATVPYFVLYVRDLKKIGYRASDVVRVYALNLLLVPANLGGVFRSIQQMITGKRAPFIRTPKVSARVGTPLFYLVASYGFLFYCGLQFVLDMVSAQLLHGVFALVNGGLLTYAIYRFVGLKESREDFLAAVARKPALPQTISAQVQRPATTKEAFDRLAG
jgi:cellulose synthase/poly-beta-1,6-N-acetylglucosamine synthase-like glycosyltransferase